MAQTLNLIWQKKGLVEREWIHFLFENFSVNDIYDYDRAQLVENSIVIDDLVGLDDRYLKEIEKTNNCILFHVSDESYRLDYKLYKSFSAVIRNYWAPAFDVPGVLVVPLGCRGAQSLDPSVKSASERSRLWSFVGTINSTRPDMLKALKPITPNLNYVVPPGSGQSAYMSHHQYSKVLLDSVFSPCPMGNLNIESFRLYEALNAGCVPIVEKRLLLNYYRKLLGENPLICVSSWRDAADIIYDMNRNPVSLNRKQAEIIGWWSKVKREQQHNVTDFVSAAFMGRFDMKGNDTLRVTYPHLGRRWRYFELVRHHSASALCRRVKVQIGRILRGRQDGRT